MNLVWILQRPMRMLTSGYTLAKTSPILEIGE